MACRVTLAPPERAVAESARPVPSFLTTESRVPSPRAKTTPATACSVAFDIFAKVLRLCGPAALVHSERALSPMSRNAIEARFDDGEQRAFGNRLETELDERRRLVLGVRVRIDPVWDPAK